MKALPVALTICVAFSLTSSFAEAKQTKRHKKVKPLWPSRGARVGSSSSLPA